MVEEPKLEVMSLRTTPLSVNTLAPLDPSPGYGPAVSSGISPADTSRLLPPPLPPSPGGEPPGRAPRGDPSAGVAAVSEDVVWAVAQPARATTDAPATSLSIPRRCSNLGRS